MKKKKRGPAKIDVVASIDGKRMDVLFNEIGQAVGDNSIKLSSYIGSLVKQMVPITLNSWHEADEDLRKRLWICVQQQFIIDDCYRDYILMMMGKIWRTYKSELSRKIRAVIKSKDVIDHLAALREMKPQNIKSEQQWNNSL